MSESIYEFDGDRFVPTDIARGPWSPESHHGGPPAMLMARALEALALPGRIARITVDLLRPIPLEPLSVETRAGPSGRQVRRTEAVLRMGEREMARAHALHIRQEPLDHVVDLSLTVLPGESDLPAPDAADGGDLTGRAAYRGFHTDGVEVRFARGSLRTWGTSAAWFRLRVPLVPGETPSPLIRSLAAADFPNGLSAVLPWRSHVFINPDFTLHLSREPIGEWIGVDAVTRPGPDGIGIAEGRMLDTEGTVGRSIQTLLMAALPDRRSR